MRLEGSAPGGACGLDAAPRDLATLRRLDIGTFRSGPRRAARVRAAAGRFAATVGICVVLAVAAAGTALAPAAAGSRSDHGLGPSAILVTPGLPVDAFELRIPFGAGAIGGELRELVDRARRDRNPAADHDPDEIVRFDGIAIRRWLVDTILNAAETTGVDPVYMMALADKESSFMLQAKASTSSAEGLFQFLARTWLEVVREFGPRHGLAAEAAGIELAGGQPVVADPDLRQRILGLRRDPHLSALMAGELLKRNRAALEGRVGRDMTGTEDYLAHFFGATAARRFLELVGEKPTQNATRLFRAAARANRPLFYAREGRRERGLSVAEVYDRIDRMIDARLDRYRTVTALASGNVEASRGAEPAL